MDAAAYVVWQVLVGGTAVTAAMAVMLVLPAPSNEIREFVTSKTSAILRIHKVRASLVNQSGLVHTAAFLQLPLHPLPPEPKHSYRHHYNRQQGNSSSSSATASSMSSNHCHNSHLPCAALAYNLMDANHTIC
jgi:hypothetical protein